MLKWTWIRPGLSVPVDRNGDLVWTPFLDLALQLAALNDSVVVDAEKYIELGILVDRHVFPVGCRSRVRWQIQQPQPSFWRKVLYEMTCKGWKWLNGTFPIAKPVIWHPKG